MEKKVHFKLHKVKKHWVTIAVTGLALGLGFAGLSYASAEEQPTAVNEATVEAIIKEGAIDVDAPASNEATTKPTENTTTTASSEAATVSEAPVASSEVASTETVSEKPSSEVTSTFVSASETHNSESKSSVATSVTEKTSDTESHEDRTIDVTDRGIYPPPPWSSRLENVTGGEYYTDDDGFWHYRNENGDDYIGGHTIDGVKVYFDYKGRQVKGRFGLDQHFYDKDSGALVTSSYVNDGYNTYYVNKEGYRLIGHQKINGEWTYFNDSGAQLKESFDPEGRYYDENGRRTDLGTNHYFQLHNKWYYIGNDGKILKGAQTIDGVKVYFGNYDGIQVKGDFAVNGKYYDGITGALVTNSYVRVGSDWYYVNSKGKRLKGAQIINNVAVYFNPQNGKQLKGGFDEDGYFYDKDSGAKTDLGKNHYVQINDAWYYIGSEGKILKGEQTIDGVQVHFDTITGVQVKGNFITKDGRLITEKDHASYTPAEKFFDKDSGALVKGRYFTHKGKWYYANDQGILLKGSQTIDGVNVYFHPYYFGGQAKDLVLDGYYYDKDTGARQEIPKNTFFKAGNKLYYFDSNGDFGRMTIDGKDYCVYSWGEVIRGGLGPYNTLPYYDEETGAAIHKTGLIKSGNNWFYLDENGRKVKGLREINGKIYYFSDGPESRYGHYYDQVRGLLVNPYNENYYNSTSKAAPTYFFDAETGAALTNQFFNWGGDWYYFGPDGKALIFDQVINGQHLYFRNNGKQVKGQFISDYKGTRYYDENSGELVTNQTRTINGVTYHFDENGRPTQL